MVVYSGILIKAESDKSHRKGQDKFPLKFRVKRLVHAEGIMKRMAFQ